MNFWRDLERKIQAGTADRPKKKTAGELRGVWSSWPPAGEATWRSLWKCKDEFLKEVKEKRISSYEPAYITEVRILVNPADMEAVEENR